MYNKSQIMKRAWTIFKASNKTLNWSECLKQSWNIARNGINNVTFERVYNMYYNDVLNYITHRLNNNAIEAEDITQRLFVKISENLKCYDSRKAKLNTWIYTFTKNAIIDFWRKKKLNKVDIDGCVNEEGKAVFELESDNVDILEQNELKQQIMEAINGLNENEKSVVTMFFLEGRKQDEIAEILGLSKSNVKVITLRAKKKLKSKLQNIYSMLGE